MTGWLRKLRFCMVTLRIRTIDIETGTWSCFGALFPRYLRSPSFIILSSFLANGSTSFGIFKWARCFVHGG